MPYFRGPAPLDGFQAEKPCTQVGAFADFHPPGPAESMAPSLYLVPLSQEVSVSKDREVEVKFQVDDPAALSARLERAGFRQITARTHEVNTLFDQPGSKLRRRGALLRLRQFGPRWTLTYKDKSSPAGGRHKSRREIETVLEDGEATGRIVEALGFAPSFRYEKFRSEWGDGTGHVVIDETPIGNYAEIEGQPKWIDATARLMAVHPEQYITLSYTELFAAWKRKTRSKATEMTFAAIKRAR